MAERSWWNLSRLPGEGDVCEKNRKWTWWAGSRKSAAVGRWTKRPNYLDFREPGLRRLAWGWGVVWSSKCVSSDSGDLGV